MANFNPTDFQDPVEAFRQRGTKSLTEQAVDVEAFRQHGTQPLYANQAEAVDAFRERGSRDYRPDPARVDAVERRRAFTVAAQQNYGLDSEGAEELYRAHLEGRKMGFWETGWHNLKEKIDPVLHAEAGRNIVAASRLSKTRYGREIDLADKTSVIKGGMKASGVFSIDTSPSPEESQAVLDAGFSEPVARMMTLSQAQRFYKRGLEVHRKAEKYTQSARYQQDLKDVDKYFRHQGRLAAERELRGQTWRGKVGGGFSDTAIWMVELYATGGLGGIVSAEAKLGAKAAIKGLLKSAVSPKVIAASAARAAILPSTATEAMAKIAPHLSVSKDGEVSVQKEGMPYFEAISGSLIDKAIAVHAEKMGAGFGQVGKAALRTFPTGRKILAALKKGFSAKHPKGSPQAFAKEFFKRAEFHGVISESLEERAEDLMRFAAGRQDNLLPSLEEWGIELAVLGILKGGQISLTGGGTALESLAALGERKTEEAEKRFEAAEKAIAAEQKTEGAEPDYSKAGEAVQAAAVELAAAHKADFTYTPDKPLLLSDAVADKTMVHHTEEVATDLIAAAGLPAGTPLNEVEILGFNVPGDPIIGSKDSIYIAQGGDVYTVVEEIFELNAKNLDRHEQVELVHELEAYELVNGRLTQGSSQERLSDLARAAAFNSKLHRKLGFRLKEIVVGIRDRISKLIGNARTLRAQVRAGNVSESFLKKIEDVTYQRAIDQQLEKIAGQIQQVGVEPEIKAEVGEAAVEPEKILKQRIYGHPQFGEAIDRTREFNKPRTSKARKSELIKVTPSLEAKIAADIGVTAQDVSNMVAESLGVTTEAIPPYSFAERAKPKPAEKKPAPKPAVEPTIANVFTRMPQDVLESQAQAGVAGAKAEVERRKTDGLSAAITRLLPSPESEYKEVKIRPKKGFKNLSITAVKNVGTFIADYARPLTSYLESISVVLFRRLRRFEYDSRQKIKDRLDGVLPLFEKSIKISNNIKEEITLHLNNGDFDAAYSLLEPMGVKKSELRAAQEVFNEIYDEAKKVGINLGYTQNFWPRAVKDIDELRTFLAEQRGEQYWSSFEAAIRQRERELGKPLVGQERTDYINQLIRGYGSSRIQISGQGHTKGRVLKRLDAETNEHYLSFEVSMVQYIQQMTEAIEARKMFGMGKNSGDVEDPIGTYVHNLVKHKAITPQQERKVVEIFTARFTSKSPRSIIRKYRHFEYIETLGSTLVALSQLDDLGIAWYRAGILTGLPSVMANFSKAALNKSEIKLIQQGINDIAAELTDPAHTAEVLDFVLRATGFKYLDRVGKETIMNTVIQKYYKQAKNPTADFRRRITRVFGSRANEVIATMKRGVMNDDVQYLAFNELLDVQPVTLSEMPLKYLQADDGKVLWMLKSFMLRRLDFMLNETVRQIATNPVQGIINGMRLMMALMVMGVATDELKDWILGRKSSLSDQATDNLLKLAGLSKYNIYDAKTRGGWKAMFSQIAPPFKFVDSGGRDLKALTEGELKLHEAELLSSVPFVGKILYWRVGKGAEKEKKKRIRERPQPIREELFKRLGPKKERSR